MAWTDDGFQTAEKSARSVFVGNIPYDTSEEQLKDIFRAAGKVLSFRLVYDRESGKPKGYGFCEYEDQETALSAMRNLNGFEFNGRQLRVDSAAADKGKEELSAAEAVSSPYGEAVEPEKAPEAISRAVASLPPEQMFELMKQMKLCIQNNPTEARNMLLQNPQLAYALLQAQVVMRIVDPKVAMAMLHRQDNQIPPIQPSVPQAMAPPAMAPPPSATNNARPRDPSPAFSAPADVPPMDRPPVPPFGNESRDGFNGGPFNNTSGPGNNFGGNNFGGPDPRGRGNFQGPGGPQNNGPDWQRGPGPNNGNFGGPNMGGPGPNMGGPGPNMGGPGNNFMGGPGPNMGGPNMSGPNMSGPNMGGPNMGGPMGNNQFMSGPNMGGPNMSGPGPNMSGPGPNMSGPGPNMGGPMPNMSGPGPMSGPGSNMSNPSPHMPSPGPSMTASGPTMGRGGPPMSSPAQMGGARPPMAQSGPPPPSNQAPPAAVQRAPAPAAAPPAATAPASSSSTPDQEKAQLIMQVLQLSDAQIALLPPEQRQSILILKEQISRSKN